MKKNRVFLGVFFFIVYSGIVIAYLTLLLSKGENWKYLIWNGNTLGIFPDLYESMGGAVSKVPYDNASIYPAFAYCICYVMGKMIPNFDYNNWWNMSITREGIIVGGGFFLICIIITLLLIRKILGDNKIQVTVSIFFITSSPIIYAIERGNMVVLAMPLVLFYIMGYDSEKKLIRYLAYFSLACAAALKIYPAVLGFLLINRKKIKELVILVICGMTVFIIPFFVYGNIGDISKMLSNAFSLNNETVVDTRNFGYGFKISIQNTWEIFKAYFNIKFDINITIILIIITIMLIISSFLCKFKWQKITCLCLIVTIIPTFSWIYNAIYMMPALVYFIKEKKEGHISFDDYIILLLFVLIFIPLPYGFMFGLLDGVNKVSISSMVCSISLIILMIYMVIKAIIELHIKLKKNNRI